MKLVWHIFLKDLRRLAGPLALWALLLGLKFAWAWRMIAWDGVAQGQFNRMTNLEYLLVWLEVVANFLLVTRLIHEDVLVSERAFWMTRPISGARLLAAKIFGLVAMFVVLPFVVAVPWWLANHYDANLMSRAAVELILAQLAIALPAVMLAALTDGLSRLLLWLLVAASVSVWWFFVAFASDGGMGFASGTSLTRTCVVLALVVILIGTVTARQFLTRRYPRSLAITAGGVIAIGFVAWLWPWDLTANWRREFSGGPDIRVNNGASGVTFAVARAQVPDFTSKTPDYVKPELRVTLAARGVPEDSVLIDGPLVGTWRWRDGTTLERDGWGWGGRGPYTEELDVAARRMLKLKPSAIYERWFKEQKLMDWRDAAIRVRWMKITPSFAVRMHREAPAFTAKLNYLLARPEIRFETPLRAGNRQWFGAASSRPVGVLAVHEGSMNSRATVVESEPTFVRLALTLAMLQPIQSEHESLEHFVVNRRMGEAESIWGWNGNSIVVGSVRIAWKDFEVQTWQFSRDQKDAFLDGATLVGFGFRDYRYYYQELKVDRFEVTQ